MLIKSQSGNTVVNTNTMVSLYRIDNIIYCSTTHNDEDYGFVMGRYETDDNAKEALNKLYDAFNEPKYDLGGLI